MRQGDVDEVQRRRAVIAAVIVAEHAGLAERAALVGAEPLPLRVGLLDERVALRRVGRRAGLLAHQVVAAVASSSAPYAPHELSIAGRPSRSASGSTRWP